MVHNSKQQPLAYFITFHTYGSWLHGDQRGSVDREHNAFGEDFVSHNPARVEFEADQMNAPAVRLDAPRRFVVDRTIREVAQHRSWTLHALNVRTNHVHLILTAMKTRPERIMSDLKSWSTRRLRESGLIDEDAPVWSRHGSTRYLWREEQVAEKIDYVLNRQGDPLPMHSPATSESDQRPSEPRTSEPRP